MTETTFFTRSTHWGIKHTHESGQGSHKHNAHTSERHRGLNENARPGGPAAAAPSRLRPFGSVRLGCVPSSRPFVADCSSGGVRERHPRAAVSVGPRWRRSRRERDATLPFRAPRLGAALRAEVASTPVGRQVQACPLGFGSALRLWRSTRRGLVPLTFRK